MNLLPKARWIMQMLWGAIAEEERRRSSLETGKARKHTRGGVRTCLFARRQVKIALRWIVAFCGDQVLSFSRVFGWTRPPAEFELVVDASPWSLGGILTTASSSEALQFFHEPLTAEDCARFNAKLGDTKGQHYWEALSEPVGCQVAGGRQSQKRFGKSSAMHRKVGRFLTASEWNWGRNRLGA